MNGPAGWNTSIYLLSEWIFSHVLAFAQSVENPRNVTHFFSQHNVEQRVGLQQRAE